MQNFLVLFLRPRILRDRGVQVVVPPLPALLGDAPGQLLSYRGPLSGAVRAHQFDDFGLGAARVGSGARERSTGGQKYRRCERTSSSGVHGPFVLFSSASRGLAAAAVDDGGEPPSRGDARVGARGGAGVGTSIS